MGRKDGLSVGTGGRGMLGAGGMITVDCTLGQLSAAAAAEGVDDMRGEPASL